MSKNKPLSHYVPKFSSKYWTDDSQFVSYLFCEHTPSVKKTSKGRKQWGRKRGLYSWDIENSLDRDLETKVAPVYEKLVAIRELDENERLLWAQFLLSQLVRTPSYMKYERKIRDIHNTTTVPQHDRVGCQQCGDLAFVANRDWCLILAHKDDYFVRTDNPVLQSGFIERPESCLFYPLSPRLCFVACSMPNGWNAFTHNPNVTIGYEANKGWAHFINYQLAKCAGESLIISPDHDSEIADRMFNDILGSYPQPPFSLHILSDISDLDTAYDSIRRIMSITDDYKYPEWNDCEFEPFYQRHQE
ncbi:hypothetical protein A1L58_05140 [Shewanella baltica]|uniref:DUF4238 domain-containing protein n=1 Tax=Shewanella baltica TaxID=62322 RepID=UPI0007B4C71F|nr:DUF4238 domain-containing protein [Shewanella baltica]KZK66796.1 hypothetical protein A1L58_05140 [Shewanella baltica]